MAAHLVSVAGDGDTLQGRCSCHARGPITDSRLAANEWGDAHLRLVVQAQVRKSNPSLSVQRDYYREMADNWTTDPADRVLWAALADELDRRLGMFDTTEQPPLF